ncbi:non-oxidative hydroxyarylic acid decarboxylases subunit D [Neomoorella thermoacetica]|uniref:Phenolic acid decarboxylase subunit D n=1 Tax=Neomoorella thermoacetica TaxID=1525 RepID=A0A5D3HYX9_NEOTH|nr:non-oxidative hydroxyarylic acid decarboxylases subunit D [Moorella thermoacetica]AOQ22795.1 Phenolic acid decarboxylase subunit D [Moorella thermoacetica]OIQ10593.1 phenolic acid decarboxylase subunit D [Moorella thermoacetica]OIQ52758.1 phenolic acid decarboxylase subunit D [Moorella thermoacetica]TYL08309.1 Phenolic acid decarboxylase subunit D [Moorella thermoacetica]
MKCVRCLQDTASKIAEAPDGSKAWEVYGCSRCNYTWRSTEEEEVINPEKRDPYFQLVDVNIDDLMIPVPIPPLKKN